MKLEARAPPTPSNVNLASLPGVSLGERGLLAVGIAARTPTEE